MRILVVFVFSNLLFSISAQAQSCFAEECSVTEQSYNQSMDRIRDMYPGLTVISDWDEDRPQAFASFRRMVVSGGFARKNDITLGGLITVSCHEVGHAMFRLNEGEADYFASKICMKDYFNDRSETVVKQYVSLSNDLLQECQSVFDGDEAYRCVRIAVSSQNAAQADANRCIDRMEDLLSQLETSTQQQINVPNFYFRCLRTEVDVVSTNFQKNRLQTKAENTLEDLLNGPLGFFEKDQRVVTQSYSQHNSPRCRIQTLMHGNFDLPEPRCWKTN